MALCVSFRHGKQYLTQLLSFPGERHRDVPLSQGAATVSPQESSCGGPTNRVAEQHFPRRPPHSSQTPLWPSDAVKQPVIVNQRTCSPAAWQQYWCWRYQQEMAWKQVAQVAGLGEFVKSLSHVVSQDLRPPASTLQSPVETPLEFFNITGASF